MLSRSTILTYDSLANVAIRPKDSSDLIGYIRMQSSENKMNDLEYDTSENKMNVNGDIATYNHLYLVICRNTTVYMRLVFFS